jgi:taurine dioxygenase
MPQGTTGKRLPIKPFAPALGAEIRGIQLAEGLDEETYRDVRAAFLQFGVLFFKEQAEISPATQVQIGRMFGELHLHPAAPHMPGYHEVFVIHAHRDSKVANGEFWHSDDSADSRVAGGRR